MKTKLLVFVLILLALPIMVYSFAECMPINCTAMPGKNCLYQNPGNDTHGMRVISGVLPTANTTAKILTWASADKRTGINFSAIVYKNFTVEYDRKNFDAIEYGSVLSQSGSDVIGDTFTGFQLWASSINYHYQWRYGGAWHNSIAQFAQEKWQHEKLVSDIAIDKTNLYVNGVLNDSAVPFRAGQTSMDRVLFDWQSAGTYMKIANLTIYNGTNCLGTIPTNVVISNKNISGIRYTSAVINWTTNIASNTSVNYGTTLALGTKSQTNDAVTAHSRTLSSLNSNTQYYYNITSCASSNCKTNGTYTFTTLRVPVNLTITGKYPANMTQWNINPMLFKYNVTSNETINCSLKINGLVKQSKILTPPNNKFVNFTQTITGVSALNTHQAICRATGGYQANSTVNSFYWDVVIPTLATSFINNSVWFRTIKATFNFSDDFYLHSYNISIDGNKKVSANLSITNNYIKYNMSYATYLLSNGKHTLSVRFADGHTAEEIGEYEVDRGLIFHDALTFTDKDIEATISEKDGSLFNSFTATKLIDRYSWTFEPSKLQNTYTFVIDTSDKIYIMDKPDSDIKKWIVFGDKWMDFDVLNENQIVDIKKTKDTQVEVTISNIKSPEIQIYNSIGDLNIVNKYYTFYKLNATATAQPIIFEGSASPYNLYINMTNLTQRSTSAVLFWSGTSKGRGTRTNISTSYQNFAKTFTLPTVPNGTKRWTWLFNVSGATEQFNVTGTQEYRRLNFTNCTSGYKILNYKVYDEKTKAYFKNHTIIETALTLTSIDHSMSWNFSLGWNYSVGSGNNLSICMPSGMFNYSNYSLSAITRYQSSSHVSEFHYIVNFILSLASIPKYISLYDLATNESTSFIVAYQNENYLYEADDIVDVLRYYVSEGLFRSVENGKTNVNGLTNVHLTTEDVIYKFNVYRNGTLQYTSPASTAICQSTPCTIPLRQTLNLSTATVGNIEFNLVWSQSTRTSTVNYHTKDGTNAVINLSTYKNNGYDNETVCSRQVSSSAGTLICTIPALSRNTTYIIKITDFNPINSTTLGYKIVSLGQAAANFLGGTGVLMGAFAYLTLAMMALSSGVVTIVLGILGLIAISMLGLVTGGSAIGIGSAIIWIICSGLILIYKINSRRLR